MKQELRILNFGATILDREREQQDTERSEHLEGQSIFLGKEICDEPEKVKLSYTK